MNEEILIDQVFFKKLTEILANNYTNEHFGVKELSESIPMDRSQLHRKLHALKGISASQYIREYRLQKAHAMLQDDVTTASEISYKVGFNSPTYFNTSFKDYYGYPPGEVKYQVSLSSIKSVKKDNSKLLSSLSKKDKIKQVKESISKKHIFIFSSIIVILIIGLSYNFYSDFLNNTIVSKDNIEEKSVAILPFKDMSREGDSKWFCEGIAEDIISNLSKIEGLRVISRTSSARYKKTDKLISEIANELGVFYILEGSIRKQGDSVLITAQLITANDNHLWTENYNEKLDDIFKIQSDVSKKIVQQLKIAISPEEEKTIEKLPTENLEAYHLFLKGRLINNSRKVEDLELNIKLNKQAIALDPNFALAYAEIGNSYYLMGVYSHISRTKAKNKGYYYNEKAINIDPNTFRAYAVLAMILWREDWDKAKEYHEKAIALNPNDAAAHLQYGRFFLFIPNPDIKKFLYYLTIAQRLDPFSRVVGGIFFRALIINDKIEEAEEYLNKMGFLWLKEFVLRRESIVKAYKNKDWTAAIRFFETEIEKDPNNAYLYNQLGHAYDEILNDDINFIKYSKKAYELDSTNTSNAATYHAALVEGKKFKDAKRLMQSNNFKSVLKEKQQLSSLFHYYYHQENYLKAQEVLEDSLMMDSYSFKGITYAQLGDRKKVDDIIKKNLLNENAKIFIYAILKEKDSMYYYLEKSTEINGIRGPNSRREFDPYRNEERYKSILKKNHLPITHWNE